MPRICLKSQAREKIVEFCRCFGKFRPRFISLDQASSLAEGLAIAANEGAISLHPIFISHLGIPNVVMVPIADKGSDLGLIRRLAAR